MVRETLGNLFKLKIFHIRTFQGIQILRLLNVHDVIDWCEEEQNFANPLSYATCRDDAAVNIFSEIIF